MDPAFKKRIKYYAIAICFAVAFAIYPTLSHPRVEGGILSFSLPDLEGEIVRHDAPQWQGKVLMVNLWGTWCPPCRQEIPHLIALQERYRDQGFEIVGAEFPATSPDSELSHRNALKQFKEDMGINYTLLVAGSPDSVYEHFPTLRNMKGFPTSIFIGRDGQVDYVSSGFHPKDLPAYEARIKALLAE